MIVATGQEVIGKNGRLGTLFGLRMDPKSQTAEEMVIQHGFPVHDYRLAVLGFVTAVQDGTVQVNLDRTQLGELEQYNPGAYRSEDLDRGGPSPLGEGSSDKLNNVLSNKSSDKPDRPVKETHPMAPHYPAGEETAPQENRPTVISEETYVWDNQGQKLGQVHVFGAETSTGRPERLTLKRGFMSQPDLVIPLNWVAHYGPEGIVLREAKEKVEELMKNRT